ncbi:MAG: ABC transporter ATP-binding protein [Mycoplasmoidaceae bacterium]
MSIKIQNLSFQYNKKSKFVLKDVNLNVQDKSILVLLGLNGCGKTTLLKNIVGFIKPTKGKIIVENKDIQNVPIMSRSKIIAYVPQRLEALDDVNVLDYLTFSLCNKLKFYEIPKKSQLRRIYELSKQFNIEHLLEKSLEETSGGERQIIGICAAIIQNTKYILLDEPTSALDLKNQNNVLSTLKKLAIREKKTIILTSHNPNHALFLQSNVALIKDNRINSFGKAKDIITVEKLKRIYGNKICYSKKLSYSEISFKDR